MSTAKTAVKRSGPVSQGDTGSLGMGTWTPRGERRKGSSTKSKGRPRVKILRPPPGGWTGG